LLVDELGLLLWWEVIEGGLASEEGRPGVGLGTGTDWLGEDVRWNGL
jgi:hypothetical protein